MPPTHEQLDVVNTRLSQLTTLSKDASDNARKLYFIDRHRYNCPYCNRRHVAYGVSFSHQFDWTDTKKCHVIFIKCASCEKESMHLSYLSIVKFVGGEYVFVLDVIDPAIFYSVPTSYHVINPHIPAILRELLAEAQG